ncbi:uncharacterized protein MEPE_00772 [Melanopsichium pennsylvanicum]|uniref:Uncharacterized protein n=1 Tax=Melanopsichium pennsylvanicum TaxID=63383 RepID=A0AAJ5C2Z3_9BASI|nr:uncharacterized protein MEPE_00772 [Melanopsichium pennsylvanicum]
MAAKSLCSTFLFIAVSLPIPSLCYFTKKTKERNVALRSKPASTQIMLDASYWQERAQHYSGGIKSPPSLPSQALNKNHLDFTPTRFAEKPLESDSTPLAQ